MKPITTQERAQLEWGVLVDPLMTVVEARRLADWVAANGKKLTMIYVTHGHGDHFFGAHIILERFPNTRVLASPPVVAQMRTQIAPQMMSPSIPFASIPAPCEARHGR